MGADNAATALIAPRAGGGVAAEEQQRPPHLVQYPIVTPLL
jgi:hypothetical protein